MARADHMNRTEELVFFAAKAVVNDDKAEFLRIGMDAALWDGSAASRLRAESKGSRCTA